MLSCGPAMTRAPLSTRAAPACSVPPLKFKREVLVSATGLEFAYSQAPQAMKGALMSFWLLAVTVGLVALIAAFGGLHCLVLMSWLIRAG